MIISSTKISSALIVLSFVCLASSAQTKVGIGFYPVGTEPGLGFRLNKDKPLSLDARITRANFYGGAGSPASSFLTEFSGIYRAVLLEKVRFHIGIGFRADWNFSTAHKYGVVVPIGVEAFPFPFQNAGLFFETAPFYVSDLGSRWQAGIRTSAGFVFYFPQKGDSKKDK